MPAVIGNYVYVCISLILKRGVAAEVCIYHTILEFSLH